MEGGCHCGAIRFKVNSEPFWVGSCYCKDCLKISGSPNTVFAGFNKSDFQILKGSPKVYASSKNVRRSFCEICSSPIAYAYVEGDKNEEKVFIPIGVIDDPSRLAPKKHIWVSQKLPWVHISDTLPQSEG